MNVEERGGAMVKPLPCALIPLKSVDIRHCWLDDVYLQLETVALYSLKRTKRPGLLVQSEAKSTETAQLLISGGQTSIAYGPPMNR